MNGQAICRSPNKKAKGPKSWLLRWDAGIGPDGKRHRPSETFKGTKEEADARLRAILATVDKGTNVAPSKTTVAQWIDQWLTHIAAHVTTATLEGYTHWLKSRVVPAMGELVLQRAQRTHVNALYTSLLTADPELGKKVLSAQSVQHVHRALFECLEHAKEDGLISTNPCAGAKRPAVPSATQVVLNQERMAAFLHGLAPREATDDEKARRRWRMTDANRSFLYWLSTLAACTGMRRGEILALRWSDVDLDAGVVHVRRALTQTRTFGVDVKLPKTNRGRTVNIPAQLCTMLVQYARTRRSSGCCSALARRWKPTPCFSPARPTSRTGSASRTSHPSGSQAMLRPSG